MAGSAPLGWDVSQYLDDVDVLAPDVVCELDLGLLVGELAQNYLAGLHANLPRYQSRQLCNPKKEIVSWDILTLIFSSNTLSERHICAGAEFFLIKNLLLIGLGLQLT